MTVFCGSCGTEVEEDALFCPACGEPISATAPELPPAPDWPKPPPRAAAPRGEGSPEPPGEQGDDEQPSPGTEPPGDAMEASAESAEGASVAAGPTSAADASAAPGAVTDGGEPRMGPGGEPGDEPAPGSEPGSEPGPEPREATRDVISTAPQAVPPWRRGAVLRGSQGEGVPPAPDDTAEAARGAAPPQPGSPQAARPRSGPAPVRPQALAGAPTTLSGWLIGGGSAVGLLALFLPWISGGGSYTDRWGLAYGVNVLALIALVAVAAVVFAADVIPAFPRRNLAILAVALVGVGIGLDRGTQAFAQFGAVIFLLAMLAAAAGALLVELEMDRPMGPTGGPQA